MKLKNQTKQIIDMFDITERLLILFILVSLFFVIIPKFVKFKPERILYKTRIGIQNVALKHNKLFFSEIYKKEVEKYFEEKTPEKYKELDTIMEKVKNYYDDFAKKSHNNLALSEYNFTIDEFEKELKDIDLELSYDLLKITDKHLLLPIGHIYTDYSGTYDEAIKPYFNEANIDDSSLVEFRLYFNKKCNELNLYRTKVKYLIPKAKIITMRPFHRHRARRYLIQYKNIDKLV